MNVSFCCVFDIGTVFRHSLKKSFDTYTRYFVWCQHRAVPLWRTFISSVISSTSRSFSTPLWKLAAYFTEGHLLSKILATISAAQSVVSVSTSFRQLISLVTNLPIFPVDTHFFPDHPESPSPCQHFWSSHRGHGPRSRNHDGDKCRELPLLQVRHTSVGQ